MTHSPLVRMFNCSINLNAAEEEAVRALPMRVKLLRGRQDIIRERERAPQCCVVLEGYACTYRDVRDGQRQILSFHVPGDMPDLHSLHLSAVKDNIGSIGPVAVGMIDNADLHRICREFPRVAAALWRLTLIDASIYKEWISNVGARDARSRAAHLFCEIYFRQAAIGNVQDDAFEWPITQIDLGDALGMSVVHVHRTLKSLRKAGLIDYERGVLRIPHLKALMDAGDFDAGYLEKIWEFRTGDLPEDDEPFGNQNTPVKVGDRLYLCSAMNKISALDAATGAEFWTFDPETSTDAIGYNASCRGLVYELGILPITDPNYDSEAGSGSPGSISPQAETPYGIRVNAGWRVPYTGLLCSKPPYGGIAAIDLNTREVLWDRPFGTARKNGPFGIPSMLPFEIGTPNNGGGVITASGLFFIAAATDDLFRAIDVETGERLWEVTLPAGGQATPMTYEAGGRQIVVINAGGHDFMETPIGDYFIAYALPAQSNVGEGAEQP